MSITLPIPSQKEMEQLSAGGRAVYNQTLKSTLEPLHNGQVVAIHLDSGDYEAARNSSTASRALCARHPVGLMMVTDVGPAKIDSLTLRMLGSQLLSGDSIVCWRQHRMLATEQQFPCPSYEILLDWNDEPRPAEVLILKGDPLLGTVILCEHLLQVEMIEGGEVSVGPL